MNIGLNPGPRARTVKHRGQGECHTLLTLLVYYHDRQVPLWKKTFLPARNRQSKKAQKVTRQSRENHKITKKIRLYEAVFDYLKGVCAKAPAAYGIKSVHQSVCTVQTSSYYYYYSYMYAHMSVGRCELCL